LDSRLCHWDFSL